MMQYRLAAFRLWRYASIGLGAISIFSALTNARAQSRNADSLASTRLYVIDSSFANDLPVITFGFGGNVTNGLAGINNMLAARDAAYNSAGFTVSTPRIPSSQLSFSASVRAKIIYSFGVLSELTYNPTYSSVSLSAIYVFNKASWLLAYGGLGAGYYSFSQNFGYNAEQPHSPTSGYYIFNGASYSGAAYGTHVNVGVDVFPMSMFGIGLSAAYNFVNALPDPDSKSSIDLSGYELGIQLTYHLWRLTSAPSH